MKTPQSFVEALSRVALPSVFNPYSQRCALYDHPHAAARRRRNLTRCLEAALDNRADTIWIARDLGYRGGRRTGVPLTDEVHLSDAQHLYGGIDLQRATQGPIVKERTATVTWQILTEIGKPVVLWNVFPLHPHDDGDPMSNRCHRRSEREAAWPFLIALIAMIQPAQLVAIGRDAGAALAELDVPVRTVRHPSYGGQTEFMTSVRSIYKIAADKPPVRERQRALL